MIIIVLLYILSYVRPSVYLYLERTREDLNNDWEERGGGDRIKGRERESGRFDEKSKEEFNAEED